MTANNLMETAFNIAYLNGGLDSNRALVGAGNLATAQTVTVFYMLLPGKNGEEKYL